MERVAHVHRMPWVSPARLALHGPVCMGQARTLHMQAQGAPARCCPPHLACTPGACARCCPAPRGIPMHACMLPAPATLCRRRPLPQDPPVPARRGGPGGCQGAHAGHPCACLRAPPGVGTSQGAARAFGPCALIVGAWRHGSTMGLLGVCVTGAHMRLCLCLHPCCDARLYNRCTSRGRTAAPWSSRNSSSRQYGGPAAAQHTPTATPECMHARI